MRNFRLTIQYEGTRYRGWQSHEAGDATIQGKIETVLTRLVGEPVNVIGASRTDAGVHAEHQVANFHGPDRLDPDDVLEQCNRYLPSDIAVQAVDIVPERFHARYHARLKRYLYRVWNLPHRDVFWRRTSYHVPEALDLDAMRGAAGRLVGRHDFGSFCGVRSRAKSTVRDLERLIVSRGDGMVLVTLEAAAFLYGMARIICGTLIEVGKGRVAEGTMPAILERGERRAAGFTAPACGLCLAAIQYEGEPPITAGQ
jgi:tRNA pseudouridine38-40 synthase